MKQFRWISPKTKNDLDFTEGGVKNSNEFFHEISEGIIDFRYPKILSKEDKDAEQFYDNRADDYEKYLHLTFQTYNEDEIEIRNAMIDLLDLSSESKVLEIASGTGRDSVLLAERLGECGELFLTDISHEMLLRCKNKIQNHKITAEINFALVNAMYIPLPDNYFDAVYSFGALGEFSDKTQFFKEVVRVCKPGAKVVVGDENLPIWQRETEFGRILSNYNKQFLADVPFESLPVEARNVQCKWIIGGVFYVVSFSVGEGELFANFDFQIPGVRGGTHKTRLYGQLEGVNYETKKLAWMAREKLGVSMHSWLDSIVKKEAEKVLQSDKNEMDKKRSNF
jgi:ubiquinone/menaquinone biosynthesis C-methylase UbiE